MQTVRQARPDGMRPLLPLFWSQEEGAKPSQAAEVGSDGGHQWLLPPLLLSAVLIAGQETALTFSRLPFLHFLCLSLPWN